MRTGAAAGAPIVLVHLVLGLGAAHLKNAVANRVLALLRAPLSVRFVLENHKAKTARAAAAPRECRRASARDGGRGEAAGGDGGLAEGAKEP